MGFDWEGILDASGDGLQDAYEDAIAYADKYSHEEAADYHENGEDENEDEDF